MTTWSTKARWWIDGDYVVFEPLQCPPEAQPGDHLQVYPDGPLPSKPTDEVSAGEWGRDAPLPWRPEDWRARPGSAVLAADGAWRGAERPPLLRRAAKRLRALWERGRKG